METTLRALALVLEYDGTGYHGFQRQDEVPSIAERVEAALGTLFGHPTAITAAGRTDAGVHATGQVVSCTTTSAMPLRRIVVAASALLRPYGIAVIRAVDGPTGFSARHDARARTYRYRILNRAAPSPLLAKRVFHISAQLDVEAMRAAAAALVGEHDFAAFCAVASRARGTRRNVHAVTIEREGDLLDVVVSADSFLHNMVRIIVGTLIEVGRGHRPASGVADVLRLGERTRAGFTAPAHGLYLEKVEFAGRII